MKPPCIRMGVKGTKMSNADFNLDDFSVTTEKPAGFTVYVGIPRKPVMYRAGQGHEPREAFVHFDSDTGQWYLVHNEVRAKCRLKIQKAIIVEGIQDNGTPVLTITVPPKFEYDNRAHYDNLMAGIVHGKKRWVRIVKSGYCGYTHEPAYDVDHEPAWGNETITKLITCAFADHLITMDHPLARQNIKLAELPIEEDPISYVRPAKSKQVSVQAARPVDDEEVVAANTSPVIAVRKPSRPPLRLQKNQNGWVSISE